MALLSPTRQKFAWMALLGFASVATFAIEFVPPAFKPFIWRLPRVAARLHALPIRFFDAITGDRFAPVATGSFLVLPTLAQITFAAILDLSVLYVVACVIGEWRARRSRERAL